MIFVFVPDSVKWLQNLILLLWQAWEYNLDMGRQLLGHPVQFSCIIFIYGEISHGTSIIINHKNNRPAPTEEKCHVINVINFGINALRILVRSISLLNINLVVPVRDRTLPHCDNWAITFSNRPKLWIFPPQCSTNQPVSITTDSVIACYLSELAWVSKVRNLSVFRGIRKWIIGYYIYTIQ